MWAELALSCAPAIEVVIFESAAIALLAGFDESVATNSHLQTWLAGSQTEPSGFQLAEGIAPVAGNGVAVVALFVGVQYSVATLSKTDSSDSCEGNAIVSCHCDLRLIR